jgi:hypothetical protein
MEMKIAIWVLNIDNYRPDITTHTLPTIKAYAERIGASYNEIIERKFPDFPITYEKMQVYELGKENDWNILIDADVVISSKFPNVIDFADKDPDTIISYQQCNIMDYFQKDPVFSLLPQVQKSDGSGVAIVTPSASFVVTSKKATAIYKPVGLSPEEMAKKVRLPLMVDEWNMAYQMALNQLKSKSFKHVGLPESRIYHAAVTSVESGNVDWPKEIEKIEGKSKTLMLTVASKEFEVISSLTHLNLKNYAEKIGADFHSISESDQIKDPEKQKFLISDYLETYDRVLYVDSDLIIREDAPNIFEIVPDGFLGALYESRFVPKTQELNNVLSAIKLPENEWLNKFYGCGVIVASKSHADLFKQRSLLDNLSDEVAFNVNVNIMKPIVFELPYKFNYQHFMDKITGDERHAAYFVHYSGAPKKLGLKDLREIIIKDMFKWAEDSPKFEYKKNIGVVVGGGLGDQIAAEPTVRYIVEHLYKGHNIVISANWPELFKHIDAPAFEHNSKDVPSKGWFEVFTLRSPEHLIWGHISHTLTNATDYAAISALRMQLPLENRHIKLPRNGTAMLSVMGKLDDVDHTRLVVVHPGKGWKTKTFPSHVWQSYIDALVEDGNVVVVVGKTINEGQGLVEVDASRCVDLRDRLSVQELIELIRLCKVLVTNDSSPIHIAGDSDCWIGVIATCKHPDYILPYRNGSILYKTRALEESQMYFDFDRQPSTIDGSTIDKCTDERLLECLPNAQKIVDFVKEALGD